MRRTIYKIIILLLLSVLASGCSMLKDPNFKDDKIRFKDDIKINFSDKAVDTTEFVMAIDGITVTDTQRDTENSQILIDNYLIDCPSFIPNKLGSHTLRYKLGEYYYKTDVTVGDYKAPSITLQSDSYDITVNDEFKLKNIKYEVKDNLTKKEDLTIKLTGKYNVKKVGSYNLTLEVLDENDNKATKKLTLNVHEKASLEAEPNRINFYVGDKTVIKINSKGKNAEKIEWYSSNSNIVSVDNGVITGLASGTATVTVKCGNGLSKDISVTVNNKPAPSNNNQNSSNSNDNSNNSNSSSSNNSSSNSNSNSGSTNKKNPSQYNKFFSGDSIPVYEQALAYAERIFASGSVNSYSVEPTGTGYQVLFT